MWLRRRKFVSFKKSIQNGLRSLLSFSWSSWQHLSVLPSLWASVDGALVLPEMQLLDRKQADIGSLWPSLAAFSRAYETKLLQVRVRKQGRTWRRTWQEGGKDLSNDLLVRFRICRFQSSKKKNCGYFFVPIVAKKAPAVWCHFSSSRTSRLALKFLKMKLMMKAFYRPEIASRRPQLEPTAEGLRQHDEVFKMNVVWFARFSYPSRSKQSRDWELRSRLTFANFMKACHFFQKALERQANEFPAVCHWLGSWALAIHWWSAFSNLKRTCLVVFAISNNYGHQSTGHQKPLGFLTRAGCGSGRHASKSNIPSSCFLAGC